MREPVAPCKGCEERFEGCWGKCPKYLAFKKEHEEWKKIVAKGRLDQYEQNDIIRQRFKNANAYRQKKDRGIV